MTADEFKIWRKDIMGFRSQDDAAAALGLSKGSILLYETGIRRDNGKAVEIPLTVQLAMAALAHGLTAWKPAS